jgi:hypothetical protein
MDDEKEEFFYNRKQQVINAIGALSPDGKHPHFRFVSYEQVLTRVREEIAKAGLQVSTTMIERPILEPFGKPGGVRAIVHLKVRICRIDDPGDSEEIEWWGEGVDYSDKAIQKAATSALKYALMKAFLISEPFDPDSQDTQEQPRQNQRSNQQQDQRQASNRGKQQPLPQQKQSISNPIDQLRSRLKGSISEPPISVEAAMAKWELWYREGRIIRDVYDTGLGIIQAEHERRNGEKIGVFQGGDINHEIHK